MADDLKINMPDILKGLADIDRCFSDSTMVIYRPTDEQRFFLDHVLRYYIEIPMDQQNEIFEAFRGRYGLLNMLIGYVYGAAEQIRLTREEVWLRTGLTAASIEDSLGKVDYRDRLLALAEIFVTAEEAGLNPGPEFDRICGIKGFTDYAVVKARRHNGKPWS